MRKNVSSLLLILFLCTQAVCGQAKYVFYFIGDGMGVNQINATEVYLSAIKGGGRGSASLLFTSFPSASFVTTYSANSDVTDSAASGTALATGTKTNNGFLGITPDNEPLETIAEKAKKAGKKVGIASTVPVNHATPAAFYGHQKDRSMYYEISQDLIKSGFDFFGGASFYNRDVKYDGTKVPDIFPLIEQAGYKLAKGYADYKADGGKSAKLILLPEKWDTPDAIPYAIDRRDNDLTLKQITEAAIETLMKDNKKGFFVMLEGGRIDWGAHGNDAATAIREIIDFDEAIAVAYEFYKKHPKETLIVITADHDTGGITVGRGSLNISYLQYQKQSQDELTKALADMVKSKNGKASWEDVKKLLGERMGLWKNVPVNWENEKILRDAYESTIARNKEITDENLYSTNSLMAAKAKEVLNSVARLAWGTGSHSGGYVPVFAIGVGQEYFTHKIDNTDIPKIIEKVARY
ncbi:MAG: alkaline phosphatase [Dysgonamonadaceae bacterium]|jgi:alkaline phosphatase|nr:alkaline phosphatase [Dysgonamonadaceae bacterium]